MDANDNWVKRLSSALGLDEYEQDWGICNSDADRILEFLAFYEQHHPRHPWDTEALAELIFESFSDALRAGQAGPAEHDALQAFVLSHRAEFPHAWNYWSGLDSEEFPISRLIRDMVAPEQELPAEEANVGRGR